MLLYKFKPISPLEHVLDVVANERLYCAPYESLNDPFEGQFQARLVRPTRFVAGSRVGEPLRRFTEKRSIAELPFGVKEMKVCSLSGAPSEVRLWSLYADGHKGLAFEFDFSGIENLVHAVKYASALPEFGDTLLTLPNPVEVLTYKTDHWEYENEYRVIGSNQHFSVEGRLKRIILGWRAPDEILDLLRKVVPAQLTIARAQLDHDAVRVHT
jgi:hypothetical protein